VALGWLEPFLFASWQDGTSNYAELVFRRFEGGVGLAAHWAGFVESPALQTPIREPEGQRTLFRADLPGAHEVRLIGSFNRWNPDALPMVEVRPGRFEAAVPLGPGRYRYQLVVDGERLSPSDAQEYAPDGMGGLDGVVEVADPADSASGKAATR
jgi:hypothetical protein